VQITARTSAGRSARLDTAYAALVDTLNTELAEWITVWAPAMTQQQATVLAALGINGILGARFATNLFHQSEAQVPDDHYLAEWTEVLAGRIQAFSRD
jgi:hypothetical protein